VVHVTIIPVILGEEVATAEIIGAVESSLAPAVVKEEMEEVAKLSEESLDLTLK